MSRWSKVKAALLVGALLPALQIADCVSDLVEDVIVGAIFD